MQTTTSQSAFEFEETEKLRLWKNRIISFILFFILFVVVGISLGILPPFIHQALGLSYGWEALVIGIYYVASLCTRQYAQEAVSQKGLMVLFNGVLLALFYGILLIFAANVTSLTFVSLGVIIVARILLGISESLIVAGVFAWICSLPDCGDTHKVVLLKNIGMYSGLVCGVLLVTFAKSQFGSAAMFSITSPIPLFILFAMQLLPPVSHPITGLKISYDTILKWLLSAKIELVLAGISIIVTTWLIYSIFIKNEVVSINMLISVFAAFYILARILFLWASLKFPYFQIILITLLLGITALFMSWAGAASPLTFLPIGIAGAGLSFFLASFEQSVIRRVQPENSASIIVAYYSVRDSVLIFTIMLAYIILGLRS